MNKYGWILFVGLFFLVTQCQYRDKIVVEQDRQGMSLIVNGKNFIVKGMNWDYFPIGTNYEYSLWKQPDSIIKKALDYEMGLLKKMGVNAIRQYEGIPPKYIQYIYEKYGIYTMINHSFGRYGIAIDGAWLKNTDYSNEKVQKKLLLEVQKMTEKYKNTQGLLLYLIGNENNYGLFWEGAETESIPNGNKEKNRLAQQMYRLFNDAVKMVKRIDTTRPVAICNGDLLFIDLIAEECKDIDILGVNMYRGVSFGDAFQVVKEKLNKPILFTEFGADAFNMIENQEDEDMQSRYIVANWQEIWENTAGKGKSENCIGGFVFQFSDGWWKYKQDSNLNTHDTNASWINGGYKEDYRKDKNNMNEEWFGICTKGKPNKKGLYKLYPRKAYYSLKKYFQ